MIIREHLRLTVEKLYSMEQAREAFARSIQLTWDAAENELESGAFAARLVSALEPFKGGGCPVGISYTAQSARTAVRLGDEWRVHPTDELISRLRSLFGATAVDISYR